MKQGVAFDPSNRKLTQADGSIHSRFQGQLMVAAPGELKIRTTTQT